MKKRVICTLLTVVMGLALLMTAPMTAFAAASGSWASHADTSWYSADETEFTLTTAQQLAGLAALVGDGASFQDKTVKLGADIDLSAHFWMPIGIVRVKNIMYLENGTQEIRYVYYPFETIRFLGTFDGQGHTISGLTISDASFEFQGLFKYNSGTIKDLTINNCNILSYRYFGGVAGYNTGTIERCSVSGTVRSTGNGAGRMGGIAGYNSGRIEDCSSSATVYREQNDGESRGVGGIVGDNTGYVSGCVNTGKVRLYCKMDNSPGDYRELWAGGITGLSSGPAAVVEGCVNKGALEGHLDVDVEKHDRKAYMHIGGIAGYNADGATVKNCYNSGSLNLIDIVGRHDRYGFLWLTHSYGYAYVYAGSVVGSNASGALVESCYNMGARSFGVRSSEGGYYTRIYFSGLIGTNSGAIKNCYWMGERSTSVLFSDGPYPNYDHWQNLGGNIVSIGRFADAGGALTATDGTTLGEYKTLFDALYYGALDSIAKSDPDYKTTRYIWVKTAGYPELQKIVHVMGVTITGERKRTLYLDSDSGALRLYAQIAPSDATNKKVIWNSANAGVAKVSGDGIVTAVSPGVTTVTAKSEDGGFTDSIEVTVAYLTYDFKITSTDGGRITQGESGRGKAGDKVSIAAEAYNGHVFAGWKSSGGGSFADASSSSTVFTMPAGDVTVTAVFEPENINVSLSPGKIVYRYSANLIVAVDPKYDGCIALLEGTSGISAVISGGNARLTISAGQVPEPGTYRISVTSPDGAYGYAALIVVEEPQGLWTPVVETAPEGIVIRFAAAVSGQIKTDKGPAVIGDDGRSLEVRFNTGSGGTIHVSGVKFADLFPSYSFTFTLEY